MRIPEHQEWCRNSSELRARKDVGRGHCRGDSSRPFKLFWAPQKLLDSVVSLEGTGLHFSPAPTPGGQHGLYLRQHWRKAVGSTCWPRSVLHGFTYISRARASPGSSPQASGGGVVMSPWGGEANHCEQQQKGGPPRRLNGQSLHPVQTQAFLAQMLGGGSALSGGLSPPSVPTADC